LQEQVRQRRRAAQEVLRMLEREQARFAQGLMARIFAPARLASSSAESMRG